MSERGINALKYANVPGLVESVMAETIPMYGRMIHGVDDGGFTEESQNYDIHGRVRGPVLDLRSSLNHLTFLAAY